MENNKRLNNIINNIIIREISLPKNFKWEDNFIISLKDNSKMVYVPAGKFIMGDDSIFTAKPEHEVYLSGYLIDIYLVTNRQFYLFVKEKGYEKKEYWSEEGWKIKEEEKWKMPRYWDIKPWNEPNRPVVGISWYEAEAYANWSNKKLPTEAQWEKAARGGIWLDGDNSKKIKNPLPRRKYPWGNQDPTPELAIYKDTPIYGNRSSAPVGSVPKGKSPYGCEDLAGNVWEWCRDWYSRIYYKNSPLKNPLGPKDGDMKVLRGGSWCREHSFLRISFRTKDEPISGGWDLSGFRCVKEI